MSNCNLSIDVYESYDVVPSRAVNRARTPQKAWSPRFAKRRGSGPSLQSGAHLRRTKRTLA